MIPLAAALPSPEVLLPERIRRRRRRASWREAAKAAPQVLHLTHAECLDGAASDAVLRMSVGAHAVETAWLDPHETLDALDTISAVPGKGRRLVLTDLSLQKGQGSAVSAALSALTGAEWNVEWRDHHARQWDDAPLEAMRRLARIVVDLDGRECGATLLAADVLEPDAATARWLAAVRDNDLFLQKDPEAVPLGDARRGLGSETFVRTLLRGAGVDDPAIRAAAAEVAEERKRLAALGIASSKLVVGPNGAVVGVAYGDLPTNDVLHALYDEKGAEVAILVKPSGAFSLRSRKGVDVCHKIAARFGGGGHPNASGGSLKLPAPALPSLWILRDRHPAVRKLVKAALAEIPLERA